jgi:sterol desaturase/sphingolipid hydroxylase (fatty acid hydroxylase superfamily)
LSLERRLASPVASAHEAKIAKLLKETSDAEIFSAPSWTPLSDQHHAELFPKFIAPTPSRRWCASAFCKGELIMFLAILGVTLRGLLFTITGSCFVAEFSGYWLHRLLHSDRFPALSRGHLIHHFLIYGPKQPLRAEKYKDATEDRFSLGNIGLEWLVPSALILASAWGVLYWLHASRAYQAIALSTLILWPVFMFSYLHDRMHLRNFWMTRVPLLKSWFVQARRFHDIHHRSLNDQGRMDRNFGIGFFFFDRLFRTISKRHRPFNCSGYRIAQLRYNLNRDLQEDSSNFPSSFRAWDASRELQTAATVPRFPGTGGNPL